MRKERRMFRQKPHQIIKGRFIKAYLYFSTILIYKTTTTNINFSEYIMLEKTFSFIMAQFLLCYQKNRSKNDEPCFSAYSKYAASGILFTKQIFRWHFFQRDIKCFIECLVEYVNAGIDDKKYILITILQENIQRGILQQITNIYLFQNIFFLFFKTLN